MSVLRYPWFPYLFALALPVTLYAHNQAAFAARDVLRPVVIFLLIAALLVYIFRRLAADRTLSDTLAAAPLVALWLLGVDWQFYVALAVVAIMCVLGRRQRLPQRLVPVLNALSAGVLLLPALLVFQVESVAHTDPRARVTFSPFFAPSASNMQGGSPDIFHIVLDAYAGADALAGEFGFDNSPFFEDLGRLGFLVGESVTVPYNETVHTMSSIFLGEYLREGEFPLESEFPSMLRSTLGTLIADGPVQDILRENGYSLVYTHPGHHFLRFPYDGVVLRPETGSPLNMFEMHLGKVTGMDIVLPQLFEVTTEDPLILSVTDAFSRDYAEFDSPKFVYQHVLAPHTPFIIDREGAKTEEFPGFSTTAEGDRAVRDDPARRETYIRGYLEKLRFTNDRILDQIRRLHAAPGPKIIVLQGDHGSGAHYFLDDAEKTCLRERFSSFLAVYSNVPEIRDELKWVEDRDATPINLYRSIFNVLMGLDLDLLSRRSFFVEFSMPHRLKQLDTGRMSVPCG